MSTDNEAQVQAMLNVRASVQNSLARELGEDPARWDGADIYSGLIAHMIASGLENEMPAEAILIAVLTGLEALASHPLNKRRENAIGPAAIADCREMFKEIIRDLSV